MPKRRKFTPEFKARVVIEVLTGVKTSAQVAREYGVSAPLLSNWKAAFLKNASNLFERKNSDSEDKLRIAELERLAGRQALEIEILKKASDILRAHQNGNEK
jgi:transposase-like protein